jgi:hypothetical protein
VLNEPLIFFPLFALFFFGSIIYGVYASVRRMQASPQIIPAPELSSEIASTLPKDVADFLVAHSFRSAEFYRFHQIKLGIWSPAGGPPLQRLFYTKTPVASTFEFVAVFSDNVSLTTSRSRSAFMFPRSAGEFLQSFPNTSINQLWENHVQGTEFLIANSFAPVKECRLPFPERFRRGTVKQLSYVRSLSFWPLRGVYWFLIKRFLMQNRPIWKQDIPSLYKDAPEMNPLA